MFPQVAFCNLQQSFQQDITSLFKTQPRLKAENAA